jgi:hypothetical protein
MSLSEYPGRANPVPRDTRNMHIAPAHIARILSPNHTEYLILVPVQFETRGFYHNRESTPTPTLI